MTGPGSRRGFFWPLLIGAVSLEAVAAASFAAAALSDPVPRRIYDYSGSQTEIFGRATSLNWSSDTGFLIAAIACAALGVVALVAATYAAHRWETIRSRA